MISPVGCADDMFLRQQKLFQQRQLLLKRQRDFSRNSFGVVAQQDAALMAPTIRKNSASASAWHVAGTCSVEKLSLADSSSLVTVVVPEAPSDGSVERDTDFTTATRPALQQSLICGTSQVSGRCFPACLPTSTTPGTDLKQQKCLGAELTSPEKPAGAAGQSPTAMHCWSLQGLADEPPTSQEKPRGRKLWRPWGASKRAHIQKCATELPQEPIQAIQEEPRVSISSDAIAYSADRSNLVGLCRAGTPWQATPESTRASITFATDASEHCRSRSGSQPLCRAATPWQDSDEDALDTSCGSDLSSIPGLVDEDQNAVDDAIETDDAESALGESGDSGIERMVCQWKAEEAKQSPTKSRFERLKGLLPAKFRRETDISTSISQTPVRPLALDLD